jgi:hypothetical protein
MKEPHWLLQSAENTHSQSGEDGIIAKVLSMLPERDRMCVEFGAWDGVFLSNVRRLIEEESYSAVLIEGDGEKFQQLRANYNGNDKVIPLNCFVGFETDNGLDALLTPLSVSVDFDFLSIDIDGNDFHVWQAINVYRPKLICVEFNPTIPTEVDFVQPADPRVNQGCSLTALCRLAQEKGYELICILPFNAFFIDVKYFHLFEIADNSPGALRQDVSLVTWLFSGFDGSIHIAGSKTLPWHGMKMHERDVQVLPRSLRSYPGTYSTLQSLVLRMYKRWREFRFPQQKRTRRGKRGKNANSPSRRSRSS